MNELEQLWRERIDWVQASGLIIAEAIAEPGVPVASVYRWEKLRAESPVSRRHRASAVMRTARATNSLQATLPFVGPLTLPRPPHSRHSHANDYRDEPVPPPHCALP
jgi:hypothetical protein